MIKEAIVKIVDKQDLTYDEAYTVITEIMSGETTPTQNAAFLAALSTKSTKAETIEEITGCAAAMRDKATKLVHNLDVMEIVGTGGDNAHSFNISTTTAIVCAAAGLKIAKHGNRAASSDCGTADCLEALGVNINLEPEKCLELLEQVGFCFFCTEIPYLNEICGRYQKGAWHPYRVQHSRSSHKPASPQRQLLGVYDPSLVEPLAQVLMKLGVKKGMVVYGQDKLDEISLCAPTTVSEFKDGWFRTSEITPEEFGFERCKREDLLGGKPAENAEITRSILSGKKGHRRNAVLLNAGAALCIGEKAETIADGIKLAAEIIDSGKAMETLEKLIELSNS